MTEYFAQHWCCEVFESGYHNGAACTEVNQHHEGWGCRWVYRATIEADEYERDILR